MKNKIEFQACSPPSCKCPRVKYNPKENFLVSIFDDYNSVVSMTPEQMDILALEWCRQRELTLGENKMQDQLEFWK